MEFVYSMKVDPSLYETDGLDVGIPLRRHRDISKEAEATLRAQKDWSTLVGSMKNYQGGLHREFSFLCVTVPECRPERLDIISYSNEYAFLYDGNDSLGKNLFSAHH
jgi:hypothetical protein